MKKKIFVLLLLLMGSRSLSYGQGYSQFEKIPLQVGIVNPTKPIGGIPRTPMVLPKVSQDGHTLYFNNVGYDLTLVLLDDEENEVYSTLVPAGATAVMLPSSLNGTYELQLYPGGNYYFFSDITLY